MGTGLRGAAGGSGRASAYSVFSILCVQVLMAGPGRSGNLVINGGFDTDVSGWTLFDPSGPLLLSWSTDDANGNDDSGSLKAASTGTEAFNTGFQQCISSGIVGGAAYDFGAKIGILAGGPQGQTFFRVSWHSATTPSCAGAALETILIDATAVGRFEAYSRSNVLAPPGATTATISGSIVKNFANPLAYAALFDDIYLTSAGECHPDYTTLCLDDAPGDQRFEARTSYATVQGGGLAGSGTPVSLVELGLRRGGLFWFFASDNPEILVKVLNGCGLNDKYWVFFSAGTNVGFTLTVRDTVTGAVKTYHSEDLKASVPVQDTDAFACTP